VLLVAIAAFVVILFEINLNGVLTRASVGLGHESELGERGCCGAMVICCAVEMKFRCFEGS